MFNVLACCALPVMASNALIQPLFLCIVAESLLPQLIINYLLSQAAEFCMFPGPATSQDIKDAPAEAVQAVYPGFQNAPPRIARCSNACGLSSPGYVLLPRAPSKGHLQAIQETTAME